MSRLLSLRTMIINLALGCFITQPWSFLYSTFIEHPISEHYVNVPSLVIYAISTGILGLAWKRWRFSDPVVARWFSTMTPKLFKRHRVIIDHSVGELTTRWAVMQTWAYEHGMITSFDFGALDGEHLMTVEDRLARNLSLSPAKSRYVYDCRFLHIKDAIHFKLMWAG